MFSWARAFDEKTLQHNRLYGTLILCNREARVARYKGQFVRFQLRFLNHLELFTRGELITKLAEIETCNDKGRWS